MPSPAPRIPTIRYRATVVRMGLTPFSLESHRMAQRKNGEDEQQSASVVQSDNPRNGQRGRAEGGNKRSVTEREPSSSVGAVLAPELLWGADPNRFAALDRGPYNRLATFPSALCHTPLAKEGQAVSSQQPSGHDLIQHANPAKPTYSENSVSWSRSGNPLRSSLHFHPFTLNSPPSPGFSRLATSHYSTTARTVSNTIRYCKPFFTWFARSAAAPRWSPACRRPSARHLPRPAGAAARTQTIGG